MIWEVLTSGRLGDRPLMPPFLRALLEQEPQCSGFLWAHTLTAGIMETACGSPGCREQCPRPLPKSCPPGTEDVVSFRNRAFPVMTHYDEVVVHLGGPRPVMSLEEKTDMQGKDSHVLTATGIG